MTETEIKKRIKICFYNLDLHAEEIRVTGKLRTKVSFKDFTKNYLELKDLVSKLSKGKYSFDVDKEGSVNVKIKVIEGGAIPFMDSMFSSAYSVIAREVLKTGIDPNLFICKLGFSLEIPEDYRAVLVPRESLTGTGWIMQNSPSLSNSNYRGEYEMRFRNIDRNRSFPYRPEDIIGYLFFERIIPVKFNVSKQLSETIYEKRD